MYTAADRGERKLTSVEMGGTRYRRGLPATVPYVIGSGMSGFDPTKGFVTNGYDEHPPGRNALLMPFEGVEAAERINCAPPSPSSKSRGDGSLDTANIRPALERLLDRICAARCPDL